ncbi:MAG: bifunctional 3-(3-hydroxy-phenyl)propionate/3-hydroxycinnamic acid hydroxylase [Pseudomonadota bacterium]
MDDLSADAAIIGLGPVGATLANHLARQGLSVLVIEKDQAPHTIPRAVHLDDEALRCFQACGLSDAVEAICRINPGTLFVDRDGRVLVDWSRPSEIGPLGWHASYRFHQPDLEDVLRAGLEHFENATIRQGHEVTHLKQETGGVTLRFRSSETGETTTAHANYVIGCDGARSFTRQFLEAGYEDLGFKEQWLVVDILLKHPRPDLGGHTLQHCDPDYPATYVCGTGPRRRWEFRLAADTPLEKATEPETVWSYLSRWRLDSSDAEIERAAIYTFRSRIAKTWRLDRVLLAGDAAHQTPPFMGQGLCAGIRDVANLAWKLARVHRGRSNPSLLDTYSSERIPHVRRYIELAVDMGRMINMTDMSRLIQAADDGKGDSRKLAASIRPPLGPGLGPRGNGTRGHLMPQWRRADGSRSDAAMDGHPALYTLPEHERAFRDAAGDRLLAADVRLVTDNAELFRNWLSDRSAIAALVRPDGYALDSVDSVDTLESLIADSVFH